MRILLALFLVSAAAAAIWAARDQPLSAPDWSAKIEGLSYNPSHLYTNADNYTSASDVQQLDDIIRGDLEHLAKYTTRIRTYSVNGGLDQVPYVAGQVGLKVTLGLWLSDDRALNDVELARGIVVINDNADVIDRVIVGNEVVLRGELSASDLIAYIKRVKDAITDKSIEVGTADVWATWLRYPVLAEESDFVGAHLLPYWEGIASQDGMRYINQRLARLEKAFPGKKIVIAEAGWPSEGRVKQGSVPSAAMEAYFIRHFLAMAASKKLDYYLIEAYDQPWKAEQEGAVGAYWGLFDAERATKFAFTGALSSFAQWPAYATAAAGATFLFGAVVLLRIPRVRMKGYLLLGAVVAIVVSGGLLLFDSASLRYADWNTVFGAVVVAPAVLFTSVLLITETIEWVLSLWRKRRVRVPVPPMPVTPLVSIHVPTHNEPPSMVIQTLNALARLDYTNFEVIVLDNNTSDEQLWRPVDVHCRSLGKRFRFVHLEGVTGFKAGALNHALELTHPDAEFIAVIDSDYQAAPQWLSTVLPEFCQSDVAVVQAPQDYRDAAENLFKTFCFEEYRGFFHVGMVERNEHNAIIQHGTMCVIRRTALEQIGGWGEWCITEDTELGLRLFEAGFRGRYLPQSLGRGLMPDTYAAYKAQRYRWVYGAMQILKRHFGALCTRRGTLTRAQRYLFVAGWLPWFADAFALVFTALALVWTALMTLAPRMFDVPLTALSCSALVLFLVKTVKTLALQRAKMGASLPRSFAAAVAGLSLSFVVGKAVVLGLLTSNSPFVRTPKCETTAPWSSALRMVITEALLLVGTLAAIWAMVVKGVDDPAEIAWMAALVVVAVPYAAAVLMALGSTMQAGRPRPAPEVAPAPATPSKTHDLDLAA